MCNCLTQSSKSVDLSRVGYRVGYIFKIVGSRTECLLIETRNRTRFRTLAWPTSITDAAFSRFRLFRRFVKNSIKFVTILPTVSSIFLTIIIPPASDWLIRCRNGINRRNLFPEGMHNAFIIFGSFGISSARTRRPSGMVWSISILGQNSCQKFRLMSKISIFVKNFDFCQNLDF